MNLPYTVWEPKKEIDIVVMTIIVGGKANDALVAIMGLLYKRYGQEP
jgi:hypothetical protein